MPGIGVIINSNSKIFKKHPEKIEILSRITEGNGLFRATEKPSEIEEVAVEFRDKNIDILAISGGDGTCQMTLSKFVQVYDDNLLPQIALLRGGTMNTVATSLKIRGSPEKILTKLLEKYNKNENFPIAERNLIKVNDDYGFIFGNGIFCNFLKIYYEKAYPSPLKGFLLLSRVVFSLLVNSHFSREIFKNFKVKLILGGCDLGEGDFSCITCSTIPYIGFSFNPYPRALEKTDSFHILGFPKKPMSIVRHMPDFFLGKEVNDKEIFQAVSNEVVLETERPIGYQLDGNVISNGRKTIIKIGPRIKFISGENY